jgi:hypothetical protein
MNNFDKFGAWICDNIYIEYMLLFDKSKTIKLLSNTSVKLVGIYLFLWENDYILKICISHY